MTTIQRACLSALMLVVSGSAAASAQDDFENPPISYSESTPENCISRLQQRLDSGEVTLQRDSKQGYLKSVLQALNVPVESQMLVFSKTSLQLRRINPRTPRAVYFNDDVYIGFCQNGDVLEVSAVDPQLGTIFYSLDQHATDSVPRFERRTDNCLVCHSSSRTEGVPGHLVRSLYVDEAGQPLLSAGSRSVNHTTPLEHRWGGWYVTGQHGSQKHLGNIIVPDRQAPEQADHQQGLNVTTLDDRFDVSRYLTPHSDIVALMVLEHQALVQNRITMANFATRQALAYDTMMGSVLQHPEGTLLESTQRRIHSAGDKLVEALLLVDEAPLTDTIRGTSGYAELFAAQGPRDGHGRSLRELDLTRRLFKYPCSYLIYSESFDSLPKELATYVWQRLWDVLSAEEPPPQFAHLSAEDRQAIIEILRETKDNLPENWKPSPNASLSTAP